MPTHSHKADPAACKLCARLTKKAGEPTKCKWHGGAGAKTASGGGKRKAKPRAAKRGRIVRDPAPPNGHVVDLKDNVARATAQTLLGQLEALRGRLDEKIVHVRELAEIL